MLRKNRRKNRLKYRLHVAAALAALGLVATTAPAEALPAWRTTPTSHTHDAFGIVANLRYAEHAKFDRVVIDLRRHVPGYRISYVKRLFFDPSGKPVGLAGRQKMSLTIRPAAGHRANGENVYAGPRKVQVDLPTLRGIAITGDFENVVSFGFSTDRKAPYRVFTLQSPRRLVIDWQH